MGVPKMLLAKVARQMVVTGMRREARSGTKVQKTLVPKLGRQLARVNGMPRAHGVQQKAQSGTKVHKTLGGRVVPLAGLECPWLSPAIRLCCVQAPAHRQHG